MTVISSTDYDLFNHFLIIIKNLKTNYFDYKNV